MNKLTLEELFTVEVSTQVETLSKVELLEVLTAR